MFELALFTVVPAAVAAALHLGFRRLVPAEKLLEHHDVAGFLVSIVGVLYAVVLGFLVVNVWTAYDSAQRNANGEAGDVGEVFALVNDVEEPARSRIRTVLADYAFEVRDKEWSMLAGGRQDVHARKLLAEAVHALARTPIRETALGPALSDSAFRNAVLADLHDLSIHRRLRVIDANAHLPPMLYAALVVGAVFVFAFVLLFGVPDRTLQLTMTALVIGTIGLLIGVIVAFDHPYRGGIHVSPEAWTLVIENNELATFRSSPPAGVRAVRTP